MSIKAKLLLVLVLLTINAGVLIGLAKYKLDAAGDQLVELVENDVEQVRLLTEVEGFTYAAALYRTQHTASSDAGKRAELEKKLREQLAHVNDNLSAVEKVSLSAEDKASAQELIADAAKYTSATEQYLTLPYGDGRIEDLVRQIASTRVAMAAKVDAFNDEETSGMREDAAEAQASIHAAEMNMIIFGGGASLLLLMIGGYVVLAQTLMPLARIEGSMKKLAEGELETDVPFQGRKDEIGRMAASVQVFKVNGLRARELEAQAMQEKARAEADKRKAMLKLADDFEASVKGVVNAVAASATEMKASSDTLGNTATDTSHRANGVAAAATQASSNVQTVATATEELSASIREISSQVQASTRAARDAVGKAQRTNEQVESLALAAQKIGDVVQMISDIANQTNLLALNATIEAARAGEAGKGFAVVASEVKSLASQTAKATDEISGQIGAIQNATRDAVTAIREISSAIGELDQIAATIASAVEEQGAATQEIARNVQEAAKGTEDVTQNIEVVSRAAGETGAAATQLQGAAQELSRQGEALRGEVDAFIGKVRAA